jgi:hypothetical protein
MHLTLATTNSWIGHNPVKDASEAADSGPVVVQQRQPFARCACYLIPVPRLSGGGGLFTSPQSCEHVSL